MEYLLIYLIGQIDNIKVFLTIVSIFILFPCIVCFTVIYVEQRIISKNFIYLILLGLLILAISVLIPSSKTLVNMITVNTTIESNYSLIK